MLLTIVRLRLTTHLYLSWKIKFRFCKKSLYSSHYLVIHSVLKKNGQNCILQDIFLQLNLLHSSPLKYLDLTTNNLSRVT